MKKKTEGRKYRWAVPFRNSLMLNGQGYGIDPRFYDSKPLWPLIHMLYFLSIFAYSFDFAEIFAKKLRSVNDTAEPSFAVSLTLWSQTKVFCNFCQIFLLQYKEAVSWNLLHCFSWFIVKNLFSYSFKVLKILLGSFNVKKWYCIRGVHDTSE